MCIVCIISYLKMPCWLLKAFPNCHSVCHQTTNMNVPISTYGGSNHGSPIFIRFGYPVVNSPTHSPKSLNHFLLTKKDRPCHLDQRNVHYIKSWEVLHPSYGKQYNNKPTLQSNDLETILRLVHVKIALHIVCVWTIV